MPPIPKILRLQEQEEGATGLALGSSRLVLPSNRGLKTTGLMLGARTTMRTAPGRGRVGAVGTTTTGVAVEATGSLVAIVTTSLRRGAVAPCPS